MRIFIIVLVVLAAVMFFYPKEYISSPGFVTPAAQAQFEETKARCIGFSKLTNAMEMAADAPGESLCFGVLLDAKEGAPVDEPIDTPNGKVMSIESYVTLNISNLSPVKEVLGGTYYVTSIEANEGKGVVSYEDGHIALTADFTYSMSDMSGITIHSFIVRE